MYRMMGKIDGVDPIKGYVDEKTPIRIVSAGYEVSNQTYVYERKNDRLDWQIIYIIRGEAIYYSKGREKTLKPYDLIIYPPKMPRRVIFKNTKHFWMHITGKDVKDILFKNLSKYHDSLNIKYVNCYETIFDNLIKTLQIKEEGFENKCISIFYDFLYHINNNFVGSKKMADDNQIANALIYIQNNLHKKITLNKLMSITNLSKYYLCHKFKKNIGIPPLKYIENVKIERAKELIATTNMNISQISQNLGYSNPLYFSRVFKKNTKISPTKYRKMILD